MVGWEKVEMVGWEKIEVVGWEKVEVVGWEKKKDQVVGFLQLVQIAG